MTNLLDKKKLKYKIKYNTKKNKKNKKKKSKKSKKIHVSKKYFKGGWTYQKRDTRRNSKIKTKTKTKRK